jgi:hypothetical protein
LEKFVASPAAKIFMFDLKGWVVTGQEVALAQAYMQKALQGRQALQYCADLDAHTALPAAVAQFCFQLQSVILRFDTMGTRGQCRSASAYSQLGGVLHASSWRVLDLLAGTKFGAFNCGPSVVPDAYPLDCLEKLAAKEGLDQAQQVVHGVPTEDLAPVRE